MNEGPLPFFAPGSDPGSSFVDLLRRVSPDPATGGGSGSGTAPFEITHGTTVVAIRYADGVVMAGDRRGDVRLHHRQPPHREGLPGRRLLRRRHRRRRGSGRRDGAALPGPARALREDRGRAALARGQGEPARADGARQPSRGDAGLRRRAALRRVRRAPRPRPRLQLRPDRRQVRRGRLPGQRQRGSPRSQLDQGGVARGDDARRGGRPRAARALRRRRRGRRDRRPRPRPADLPDGRGHRRHRLPRRRRRRRSSSAAQSLLGGREEGAGL